MSAAAGSGISEEALKKLQDSREALQEQVRSLVVTEQELIQAVGAEKVAATGPQSESQVGNSQSEGSESERALELIVSEIKRIGDEIIIQVIDKEMEDGEGHVSFDDELGQFFTTINK